MTNKSKIKIKNATIAMQRVLAENVPHYQCLLIWQQVLVGLLLGCLNFMTPRLL